jgi:glycosyltransferase involved in cell wall biosynthesis
LDSVLSQDYASIEVIAVDNGSTDDSLAILDEYGSQVRVLHCGRRGAAAARNVGLGAATGELIGFNDADDVWLPGKLAAQVRYMRDHPEVGIVFGQLAYWRPDATGRYEAPAEILADSNRWEIKQPLSGWIYVDELLDSHIGMITPIVRREVIETAGLFDESLEAGSDYDYWLRATHRFQAHKLEMCIALYRIHGDGITAGVRRDNLAIRILERNLRALGSAGPDGRRVSDEALRQRFSMLWRGFAMSHFERGSLLIGAKSLATSWRYAPRSLGSVASSVKPVLGALRTRWS